MLHPSHRPATLVAAVLMAFGLTAGAYAQSTDQSTTGGRATMPPPATQSTDTTKDTTKSALDRADQKFLEKAANGGMMEVQLGELAQEKAQSEQVKAFGKRMADDHGKANEELKQVASSKGIQLPASLDKKHQADVDRFSKMSGAQFDRAYMDHMVDDHKKDVADFKKEASSGKDADVKSFASKTLPTLQEHLQLAQSTYDAVKKARK